MHTCSIISPQKFNRPTFSWRYPYQDESPPLLSYIMANDSSKLSSELASSMISCARVVLVVSKLLLAFWSQHYLQLTQSFHLYFLFRCIHNLQCIHCGLYPPLECSQTDVQTDKKRMNCWHKKDTMADE